MFKKYQWNDQTLKKRSQRFEYITLGIAFLALVCLYALPQSLKIVNLPLIAVGVVTLYMSLRIQSQDRKLKKALPKPVAEG